MDGSSELKNDFYGGNNFSVVDSQFQDMSSNRKVKEDKDQIVQRLLLERQMSRKKHNPNSDESMSKNSYNQN